MRATRSSLVRVLEPALKLTSANSKTSPDLEAVLIAFKTENVMELTAVTLKGEKLVQEFSVRRVERPSERFVIDKKCLEYISSAGMEDEIEFKRIEGQFKYTVKFGNSEAVIVEPSTAWKDIKGIAEQESGAEVETFVVDKESFRESLKVAMMRSDKPDNYSPFGYIWLNGSETVAGSQALFARQGYKVEGDQEPEAAYMIESVEPLRTLLGNDESETVTVRHSATSVEYAGSNFRYSLAATGIKQKGYRPLFDRSKAKIAARLTVSKAGFIKQMERALKFSDSVMFEIDHNRQEVELLFSDDARSRKGTEKLVTVKIETLESVKANMDTKKVLKLVKGIPSEEVRFMFQANGKHGQCETVVFAEGDESSTMECLIMPRLVRKPVQKDGESE